MKQTLPRRAAFIAAILREVEDKLNPAKLGNRYSHAMVRRALSILQRELDSEASGPVGLDYPIWQYFGEKENNANWLAGALRRRTITNQSHHEIEAVLTKYVTIKLVTYNPDFLDQSFQE